MKNLIKIFAILFAFVFFACQKENVAVESEYVTVSFNATVEGLVLNEELPLTKASETYGLYGVQINLCDEHDNKRYCYGIYDDINRLQVQLKRGEQYFIRVDYFPNGKNEIPYKSNNYSPLQVMPWNDASAATLNTIVYSNYFSLDYICADYQTTCDRYCYWNENYVANDNSVIPINLLRMNGGITIDLNEVDGQEYNVIDMNLYGKTYSANLSNGDTQIVAEKIMFDMNNQGGGIPDIFYMDCTIGTPSQPTLFYNGQLAVKRNAMRTYAIRLEADMTTNGISVTYESGGFVNENGGYLN